MHVHGCVCMHERDLASFHTIPVSNTRSVTLLDSCSSRILCKGDAAAEANERNGRRAVGTFSNGDAVLPLGISSTGSITSVTHRLGPEQYQPRGCSAKQKPGEPPAPHVLTMQVLAAFLCGKRRKEREKSSPEHPDPHCVDTRCRHLPPG